MELMLHAVRLSHVDRLKLMLKACIEILAMCQMELMLKAVSRDLSHVVRWN